MAAGIKIAEGYVEFNAKDAAFNQALDRVEKRTRKTQESLDGLAESADKAFDVIADASGARGMVDQLKGLAGAGAAAYDSFKDFAKLFAGGLSLGSGLGAGLNLVSTLVPAVQQLGDVFKSLGEGTSGQKFVEQMRAASASAQSTTAALKGAKQATADLDLEYALKREDYGDRKDRWDHPEKMSAQDRAAWEAYNGSTPKYDEKANYLPDDERKRRDDQIAKLRAAALAASARVEFLSHRDNLHAAATQRLNEENPGWDKAFDHSAQAQAKRGARLTKIMQQLVNEAQEQAFETAARLVEAGNELESQNVQAFRAGSDPAQQQAREAFQQAQRKGESDQIDAQEARDRAQHPERFRGSVRVGPMDGEIPESEASARRRPTPRMLTPATGPRRWTSGATTSATSRTGPRPKVGPRISNCPAAAWSSSPTGRPTTRATTSWAGIDPSLAAARATAAAIGSRRRIWTRRPKCSAARRKCSTRPRASATRCTARAPRPRPRRMSFSG